jgi:hypothetical protein
VVYVVYRLDKYKRRQYVIRFLTHQQQRGRISRKSICMTGFSQAPEHARQFDSEQDAQQAAELMDQRTKRPAGTCVVTTLQEAMEKASKGWCRRNGFSRFVEVRQ